jgi:hypothetical protein
MREVWVNVLFVIGLIAFSGFIVYGVAGVAYYQGLHDEYVNSARAYPILSSSYWHYIYLSDVAYSACWNYMTVILIDVAVLCFAVGIGVVIHDCTAK